MRHACKVASSGGVGHGAWAAAAAANGRRPSRQRQAKSLSIRFIFVVFGATLNSAGQNPFLCLFFLFLCRLSSKSLFFLTQRQPLFLHVVFLLCWRSFVTG